MPVVRVVATALKHPLEKERMEDRLFQSHRLAVAIAEFVWIGRLCGSGEMGIVLECDS
jgi:hypothetical protein